MSSDLKKLYAFFGIISALFIFPASKILAADQESIVSQADALFGKQQFTESLNLYESLYSEGKYSEAMLYRMAYMQEQLKNYPMAIYFLKKASKEFGNPAIDAKVKQLMQLQGSERFFPSSTWDTYLKFFRQWGWLFWGLFALSIAAIVADLFLKAGKGLVWRKGLVSGAWTLGILLGAVLAHRSFFVPQLAVVTQNTAFYDFPGFAGNAVPKAFSLGETVSILDHEDIWVLVAAGDKEYWVPERVIKQL